MNLKATALKLATLGTLAAAFVVATPAKANAQVSFGVHFGGPAYYGGGYHHYYGPRPYAPYGYGYGYYGHPHPYGYYRPYRYGYYR